MGANNLARYLEVMAHEGDLKNRTEGPKRTPRVFLDEASQRYEEGMSRLHSFYT